MHTNYIKQRNLLPTTTIMLDDILQDVSDEIGSESITFCLKGLGFVNTGTLSETAKIQFIKTKQFLGGYQWLFIGIMQNVKYVNL